MILNRVMSVVLLGMLCALFIRGAEGREAGCDRPSTIRFSIIPVANVDEHFRMYQPLMQRMERLTRQSVTIVPPTSYSSVVEGLLSGRIDVAKLGPAGYASVSASKANILPFATVEKRAGYFQMAGQYYQSLLVTLGSSPYVSIAALRGTRLGLTDPGSTSGNLIPRKKFAPSNLGVSLEQYFSTVSFTGGHGKSISALLNGEIDAAFLASSQLEEALAAGVFTLPQIRIVWRSDPLPFDPFVFRGDLCADLRAKISEAFLGAEAQAELAEMLEKLLRSARFVPVTANHYMSTRNLMSP